MELKFLSLFGLVLIIASASANWIWISDDERMVNRDPARKGEYEYCKDDSDCDPHCCDVGLKCEIGDYGAPNQCVYT